MNYVPFFPEEIPIDPPKKFSGGEKFHTPDRERQAIRLSDAFDAFERDLQKQFTDISQDPALLDPEFGRVIELVGNPKYLFSDLSSIPGITIPYMGDEEEIDPNDDYFYYNKSKEGELPEKNEIKKVKFCLYLVSFTKSAADNFSKAYKAWTQDQSFESSEPRFQKFKKIFPYIHDIRKWNADDQLNLYGFHEDLLSRSKDNNESLRFEVEVFYTQNASTLDKRLKALKRRISEADGIIIGSPCIIHEIRYCGVLVEVRGSCIGDLLDQKTLKISGDGILAFRMMGQAKHEFTRDSDSTSTYSDEEIAITRESNGPFLSPTILVLDGYPLENHILLKDRLIIDDADDINEINYPLEERVHGTEVSSLILHGLIGHSSTLRQKIKLVPVNRIIKDQFGEYEGIPDTQLTVDYFHQILKKQLADESGSWRNSGIILVNVSQGIPGREYPNAHSPLARLFDWISYKANVLFLISSGNYDSDLKPADHNLPLSKDAAKIFLSSHFTTELSKKRVMSPGESVNALTIGALNWNGIEKTNKNLQIDYVQNHFLLPEIFPSVISRCGYGYGKSIKPDVLYPGGKKDIEVTYLSGITKYSLVMSSNEDSLIPVAAPSSFAGDITRKEYDSGSSLSTALATHAAGRYYEQLIEYFRDQNLPDKYYRCLPVILKALIVHGADQNCCFKEFSEILMRNSDLQGSSGRENSDIIRSIVTRWIGHGGVLSNNVLEINSNRVILIGCGNLKHDDAVKYEWEIPPALRTERVHLTITLAYFSPMNFSSQKNHHAKITFSVLPNLKGDERKKVLKSLVYNSDDSKRGTVQHNIFRLKLNNYLENRMEINVTCNFDDIHSEMRMPYGIIITLERYVSTLLTSGVSDTLYIQMKKSISQKVHVSSKI